MMTGIVQSDERSLEYIVQVQRLWGYSVRSSKSNHILCLYRYWKIIFISKIIWGYSERFRIGIRWEISLHFEVTWVQKFGSIYDELMNFAKITENVT